VKGICPNYLLCFIRGTTTVVKLGIILQSAVHGVSLPAAVGTREGDVPSFRKILKIFH